MLGFLDVLNTFLNIAYPEKILLEKIDDCNQAEMEGVCLIVVPTRSKAMAADKASMKPMWPLKGDQRKPEWTKDSPKRDVTPAATPQPAAPLPGTPTMPVESMKSQTPATVQQKRCLSIEKEDVDV